MAFSIRTATAQELAIVRQLAYSIWPVCYAQILSGSQIDYMLHRSYSLDKLREDMAEGVQHDLLFDDGIAIGFAGYGAHEGAAICKLRKLYLLPAYQGKGLGSKLLRHVIAEAARHGFRELILNVNKHNARAIALYQRRGFTTRESVCIDIGSGFVMDDYIMVRPLNAADANP